jgi:hypothetical protein
VNERPSSDAGVGGGDETLIGSDRAFGFVFAGFCAIVTAYLLWHGRPAFWGWLGAAAIFAGCAVFLPRVLHPLNLAWFKLGMLLHHVISPIVLALMFFTVFTPIGLWMRLVRKRPLHLRFERAAKSYWISRVPPGPPPASFDNQF